MARGPSDYHSVMRSSFMSHASIAWGERWRDRVSVSLSRARATSACRSACRTRTHQAGTGRTSAVHRGGRSSAATSSGWRPMVRRPRSVFGEAWPAYFLSTSSARSTTRSDGSADSNSTDGHRSPASSPGRRPHMRPVSHMAGRGSAGMASLISRRACSRVKLFRCFDSFRAGSRAVAAGLVLVRR